MSYAGIRDLMLRYGEATIIGLTDIYREGRINPTVAQQGLDDAAAEIDGYLAARYRLPLPQPVRLLTVYCCDMAVYRLATGKRQLTEEMVQRYEAALKYLKLLAEGRAMLGIEHDAAAPAPKNQVVFAAKEKVFGRDSIY